MKYEPIAIPSIIVLKTIAAACAETPMASEVKCIHKISEVRAAEPARNMAKYIKFITGPASCRLRKNSMTPLL